MGHDLLGEDLSWQSIPSISLLLPQIVTKLYAWQPPPVNFYKLNVDRAAKLVNGSTRRGVGAVVRNSEGFRMGAVVKQACDIFILATQFFALKTGSELICFGYMVPFIPGLIVESYCLKAVRLINQTEPSHVTQGILVAEI